MVSLRNPASSRRSSKVLVKSRVIIASLATACAAVPLVCFSALAVLSIASKVGDHHLAQLRSASPEPLLWNELRNAASASAASASGTLPQGVDLVSFESCFSSAPILLGSDLL